MKTSASITKIAPALVAIQAELTSIAKDAKNPHFNSRYLSNDGLIEAVRPILAAARCAIVQDATEPFYVTTTLIHESGEWIESGIPITLSKNDPQGAGSGMTYGRRYSLSALLSISADADDDGNAASRPARAKAAKQPEETPASRKGDGMFFGKPKGTPLGQYDDETLKAIVAWGKAKAEREPSVKLTEYIKTAQAILADRVLGLDDDSTVKRAVQAEEKATEGLFK